MRSRIAPPLLFLAIGLLVTAGAVIYFAMPYITGPTATFGLSCAVYDGDQLIATYEPKSSSLSILGPLATVFNPGAGPVEVMSTYKFEFFPTMSVKLTDVKPAGANADVRITVSYSATYGGSPISLSAVGPTTQTFIIPYADYAGSKEVDITDYTSASKLMPGISRVLGSQILASPPAAGSPKTLVVTYNILAEIIVNGVVTNDASWTGQTSILFQESADVTSGTISIISVSLASTLGL